MSENQIRLENLKEYITNYVQLNTNSIIYFAIGSNYYQTNTSTEWDFRENQQFPPFLHDAKLKFFNIPILIILIDPALKEEPYIVKSQNNFLAGSWNTNQTYSNLFESSLGINVISIDQYITWNEHNLQETYFNISDLITEIAEFISMPEINSLLFYQEFTGINTILLENIVKNRVAIDPNKICIDITRGSDLSCYFNLSDPQNYPVIVFEDKLKYVNPNFLTGQEKIDILYQYKKFTKGFDYTQELISGDSIILSNTNNSSNSDPVFSKYKTNYLIDKPEQMILCFQIIKSDLIMFKLLVNGIVSLIRQFHTMNNKEFFGTKMYGIPYLYAIEKKISSVNLIDLSIIEKNFKLLDFINSNKLSESESDYEEKFELHKNIILEELYNMLKLILFDILIKYGTDPMDIDIFIDDFKKTKNKYDLIKVFKNYFVSNIELN